MQSEEIFSQRVERHVLGGLIKHPKIFAEIEKFVNEKDFYFEVHHTIFCVLKSHLLEGKEIDKVILAEKIKNLGVSFKDDINIFQYIDDLSFTQITPKAVVESAKSLLKYRIRRELKNTNRDIIEYINKSANDDVNEIISTCDSMYNKRIQNYTMDDEPVNIFEDIDELIEDRGNNPIEEHGFQTPWEEFNRLYGGLRAGNLYAICARPGQGKTTWINDLCFKTAYKNKIKVLLLDTEMDSQDIKFRMASAVTGVPMWYLETGKWRHNEEMVAKVRPALERIKEFNNCHHAHVGNKDIDQICSLVRRWHLSEVGRGNPCIIAYDYVKLTGEKVGNNWAEYQAIGEKIDKLKKLSEEVGAPLVTAMQMNRSGERGGGSLVDDSSAIALSDRLQWYASFVAIFRRKTLEEIAEDGENFGTHKLIPLKTRFQGRDAAGHQDVIRRRLENGSFRWENNFLSYDVANFNVEERGSLRHIISAANERFLVEGGSENDGEILP